MMIDCNYFGIKKNKLHPVAIRFGKCNIFYVIDI